MNMLPKKSLNEYDHSLRLMDCKYYANTLMILRVFYFAYLMLRYGSISKIIEKKTIFKTDLRYDYDSTQICSPIKMLQTGIRIVETQTRYLPLHSVRDSPIPC